MGHVVLAVLSRDWAGLVAALVPALLGTAVLIVGGVSVAPAIVGATLLALATALALGALAHLVHVHRVAARHPAPGALVDVGGYRVHVLAEGEPNGAPPIVWMPGAHAPGIAYDHLHRALRREFRSILVDRPGTGWSDVGPFPRTTVGEAREVVAALEGAGERGPFIFAGHSFGGLLVANIARRWPQHVAALVLVDPTPPDTIVYGPPVPILAAMRRGAVLRALPRLFGFHGDLSEKKLRREADPGTKRIIDIVDERLGDAAVTMRAVDCGTRAACAGASIYSELSASGLAAVAWDTVLYEGDLGDMPVFLVAPGTMEEQEFAPVAAMIRAQSKGAVPFDEARLRRFYARSRERYMTTSGRARRILAPAGTGHNFPYETPDFLADVIRDVARSIGGAEATT